MLRLSATLGRSRTLVPPTSDAAARRLDQAIEAPQQRRLPGAALAHQRDALPRRDIEAHPIERRHVAVALHDLACGERQRLVTRLSLHGVLHSPKLPSLTHSSQRSRTHLAIISACSSNLPRRFGPLAIRRTRSRNSSDFCATHEIARVADVRRFPGSRAHPQFNPDSLRSALTEHGIGYTPMLELGGRRKPRPDSPHTAWRNESFRGYADYMDTTAFASAAESLATLARADNVAAMCAEGVWWRCHRSMIADYFKANGWMVLHILGAGEAKEHPYTAPAKIVDGHLTY